MTKNLVLAMLLVGATTALAQPAPPSPQPQPQPQPTDAAKNDEQKRAQAKSLYETGLSHYNLGEFDEAIKAFRAAYAISQAPGLLFNIAQSFRLKKDYEQATYFYTTYLRLKPDAPNRADVEARLQEMEELIKEQKKMEGKPPSGTVSPDGATTVTTTTTISTPGGKKTGGETPTPATTDDSEGAQSLITAGYATAGAGGALLITGLVFGRLARNAEKDLNQLNTTMGTWTQAQQDRYDAGKRNNTIAIISFIAGGAAVATGVTLYVMGTLKKSTSSSVAVVPTKQGATVAVGWTF